jgi:hypothetical protein
MTDKRAHQPMAISGLITYGTTAVRTELHFTGGIRAYKSSEGWDIGPLLRESGICAAGKVPDGQIGNLGSAAGLTLFGGDEISGIDTPLPSRVWTPLLGPPRLAQTASDTWGMISSQARLAGDNNYGGLASNIAVSLRAAGLQLRNASDEYHKQLLAALKSGQAVNKRFRNIPMEDLHLTVHSIVTEMGSARDYLAQVAARRVGAPANTDALARLKDWVKKSVNAAARNDVLVEPLLEASDPEGVDPWLDDITKYRKLFLHHEPIGTTARWLVLEERESSVGSVRTIMMAINMRPGADTICDALVRFVDLYARLCRLADFAATLAPYIAAPPAFVATNS